MFEIKHTLCPSCSVGCGINVILDNEKIVGTFPYKRHPVNEGKNCANGRNSLEKFDCKINEAVSSNSVVSVDKAFEEISKEIAKDNVTVVLSGNNSLEDAQAIKSFCEENDFEMIFYANDLGNFENVASYEDIENAPSVFVIGDILYENPLLGRRIVHAKENGAKVFSNLKSDKSVTANISDQVHSGSVQEFLDNCDDVLEELSVIVFNTVDACDELDKLKCCESKLLPVYSKINTKGVLSIADAQSKGEILEMLNGTDVLLVFDDDIVDEFDYDFKSISKIITFSAFENNTTKLSSIVVPIMSWLENDGSYVNAMGETQKFAPVMQSDALSIIEVIKKIKG